MAPRDVRPIGGILAERAGRIFAISVVTVGIFSLGIFLASFVDQMPRGEGIIFAKAASLANIYSFALFAVGGLTYFVCKMAGCSTPPYFGKWTLVALLVFLGDVLLLTAVQMARE
jgi:hypothetical protein